MTDISEPGAFGLAGEAERLALITHAQVAVVLEEAEIAELEARAFSCPSADNLRLVRRFAKRGSGSSGLEFRRPAADAASVGLR